MMAPKSPSLHSRTRLNWEGRWVSSKAAVATFLTCSLQRHHTRSPAVPVPPQPCPMVDMNTLGVFQRQRSLQISFLTGEKTLLPNLGLWVANLGIQPYPKWRISFVLQQSLVRQIQSSRKLSWCLQRYKLTGTETWETLQHFKSSKTEHCHLEKI